jgi:hypothetical protein
VLLMGLQYPWTPVNENAADAIVKLRDYQSLSYVEEILDCQHPRDVVSLPTNSQDVFLVREPVRINHSNNCLMCHPASMNEADLVRVAIPKTSNPNTDMLGFGVEPVTPYYPGASEISKPVLLEPNVFVSAQVTFLRPDHSVKLPVKTTKPAERFDFTVRLRQSTPAEQRLLQREPSHPGLFPNRPALLYILQELDKPSYLVRLLKIQAELAKNGQPAVENQLPPNRLADAAPPDKGKLKDKAPALAKGKDKEPPVALGKQPDQPPPVQKEEKDQGLARLRKPE